MRFRTVHKKATPGECQLSGGLLCLSALVFAPVKPLAQEVSSYLCSDRNKELDEICHNCSPPSCCMDRKQGKRAAQQV